jgi:hypothetical protein
VVAKLRLVACGLLVFAIICAKFLGYDQLMTYGINPGDGGVLKPLASRLLAGAIGLLIGLLPLVGMHWYLRRYIVSLATDGTSLFLQVAGWFTPHTVTFNVSELSAIAFKEGGHSPGVGVSVNAPWHALKIAGKTYIVDANNAHFDEHALRRLRSRGGAGRIAD